MNLRRLVLVASSLPVLMLASAAPVAASTTATAAEESFSLRTVPYPAGASSGYLAGESCTGVDFCVAAGDAGLKDGGALVEMWNGTSWAPEALTIPVAVHYSYLTAVSCTSSSACEAVGYYVNSEHQGGRAFGESWNGTSWTYQTVPSASVSQLWAVSCKQATACSAVGFDDNDGAGPWPSHGTASGGRSR